MTPRAMVLRGAMVALLAAVAVPAAPVAPDVSSYRGFQLGASLTAVAKRMGVSPAEARALHRRPALMQELTWRPKPLESGQEVLFRFYAGVLYRIEVHYDQFETEGLNDQDMIASLATLYGPAELIVAPAKVGFDGSGEEPPIRFAVWQDVQYRFELVHPSRPSEVWLVGVLKRLEASVRTAELEAQRLDELEAPQRAAARVVREAATANAKLEQTRLANKAKFRP